MISTSWLSFLAIVQVKYEIPGGKYCKDVLGEANSCVTCFLHSLQVTRFQVEVGQENSIVQYFKLSPYDLH